MKHSLINNLVEIELGKLVQPIDGLKRGPWGGSVKKSYFVPKGHKIYEQGNVINNDFKTGNYYIGDEKFEELKYFEVKPGDILITGAGTIGRIAVVPQGIESGIMNQALLRVRLDDKKINKQYFIHFLNFFSSFILQKKYTKGSGLKNLVAVKELKGLKIPLPFKNGKPDLKEQKRITDKIDKVRFLQEKIEIEIRNVEKLIKSVCKQEFEENKNKVKAKKLGEICNIIKGKFPILKTPAGKYPFVVTAEKRKLANDYQFDEEAVCVPLVSSTGHGHASMHRIHYEEGKFALANIMVALIPKNKKEILVKYLYHYLFFYKDLLFVPLMRGGANVTIPLNDFFDVEVFIPETKKQKRFLSKIGKIEELKQNLSEKQSLANQLFQSSLNQAFQGKL